MRILKLSLIIPALLGVLALPLFATSSVWAIDEDAKNAACQGIGSVSVGDGCNESAANTEVNNLIADVVNILSWVVGVAAVLMIIIGGFKYVTASGDSNKIASAKTTVIYAIVGLVIVALSQFIVRFVLNTATTEPPATSNSTDVDCGRQGPC